MSENCDKCGRFCSSDNNSSDYNFCDDCWYARLHRYGPEWWAIRREALQRDGYSCQGCGMANAESKREFGFGLSVHHEQPYNEGGTHELDNLTTLCVACHASVEGFK